VWWGVVLAAASLVVCAPGCYQKVTRAEGFGASRISTEEPDRQQGPVDKLIFGEDKPTKKTAK
jgi:hypothetical protein